MATGGSRVVRLFDVATRKQRAAIGGLSDDARAVAFSPDGKTVASAGMSNTLQLWDVATGTARSLTALQPITNVSVAFSPDGKTLASTGSDKKLRLWDVATGKESDACVGHEKMVWCVRFSPDGKTLASASNDHTVRLWDVATRKELARMSAAVPVLLFLPGLTSGARLAGDEADRLLALRLEKIRLDQATCRIASAAAAKKCPRLSQCCSSSPD